LKVFKVLVLTKYGSLGASSRMRFLQYLPWLQHAGVEVAVRPLLSDELLAARYQRGGYGLWPLFRAYADRFLALLECRHFDVVWVEKEALPWFPAWLERWLLRRGPYALDFDDAIFHNYDLHRSAWVRRIYGRRIDRLMEGARLVIAGNRYLADRATATGARWVEVVPTVVDLARYPAKQTYSDAAKPRIVWIGSPSTVQYLLELSEPFGVLAKRQPFTLRVIGGGTITVPGVDVESLPWSADTEAAVLAECDVGIMPLRDTPWEQGKCSYKLIQYMACGLPTVASPIGANRDVVIEDETGFFADTAYAWVEKMELLLSDAALRQRLGQAGRARVETEYCLQQTAPRLARLLTETGVQ
jgi:glycosyltransferase involved in cell wall biosynthesis